MIATSPKLICAAPDIPPGTLRLEWRSGGRAKVRLIEGNAADNIMEQFRALQDEPARESFLLSVIEQGAAHE